MSAQQPEPIGNVFCRGSIAIGTGCMRCGRCAVHLAARVKELEAWQEEVRANSPLVARLERAEQRARELEARVFKPEIKQTMNELQFDAMVRLKGLCADKPTCKAARDVFTNGMSMYAAARKHGANEPSVQSTCKSIRAALRDCYIVITGEVPGEGVQG